MEALRSLGDKLLVRRPTTTGENPNDEKPCKISV